MAAIKNLKLSFAFPDPTPRLVLAIQLLIAAVFALGAALIALGLNRSIIPAMQQWSSPALDAFFNACTLLGDQMVYIFLVAVLYWCYDPRFARDLAIIFLLGSYGNTIAKNLFMDPRPPRSYWKVEEHSYGLPSGHAQASSTAWGLLGLSGRPRALFFALAGVFIVLITVSRVYNGVHDLQDVTLGLVFGLTAVALFLVLRPVLAPRLAALDLSVKLTLTLALPIALFAVAMAAFGDAEHDFATICGGLAGLCCGSVLEQEHVGLEPPRSKKTFGLRLTLGAVVTVVALVGISMVLRGDPVLVFVRYTLIALLAVWLVPMLFRRFKL